MNGLLGGAGLGGAAGMVVHQVQRLGASGNAVQKAEGEVKEAVEKGKGKLDEVKGEVQKRL